MAAFFGDIRGNIYSLDASSGELLWKVTIDPHPLSRIMAAVKVYDGRVYVPVANREETTSAGYDYVCCTSRGIVVALDSATGKQIWKTYTITGSSKSEKELGRRQFPGAIGRERLGHAGARSQTPGRLCFDGQRILRTRRGPLGRGDGDGHGHGQDSLGPAGRTRRCLAQRELPGRTAAGRISAEERRSHPVPARSRPAAGAARRASRRRDAGSAGSLLLPRCEEDPDWDFSAGVMLIDLPNGKSLVVAGQKSGVVWAFDPDQKGELVWKSDISRGEILFGAAADDEERLLRHARRSARRRAA